MILFLEYTKECVYRIIYLILNMISIFMICFIYFEDISSIFIDIIMKSHNKSLETFIYIDVTELFYTNIYMALMCSFLINIPFLLFHIYLFMYFSWNNYQKRHMGILILFLILLYIFSMIFAMKLLIPVTWNFFCNYEINFISIEPRISTFMIFCIKILFFSIILFQSPIIHFYLLFYKIYTTDFFYKRKIFFIMNLFFFNSLILSTNVFMLFLISFILILLNELSTFLYLYHKELRKILNYYNKT